MHLIVLRMSSSVMLTVVSGSMLSNSGKFDRAGPGSLSKVQTDAKNLLNSSALFLSCCHRGCWSLLIHLFQSGF